MLGLFPRVLSFSSILTAVLVFFSSASVALGYPARQFGDWLFLLPILTPLFVAAIAVAAFFVRTNSRLVSGCFWGVFAGANLLLLHQALRLSLQHELISADGTAYWSLLSLPSLYGGLAAVSLGGVLGLGAGLVIQCLVPRDAKQSP